VSDQQGFSPILGRDVTTVHYGVGEIHGMRGLLDNLLGSIEPTLRRPMSGRPSSSSAIW